ncbi:MAG: hypothetical protein WC467_03520 [Patescibacteria group bacterium]
MILKNKKKIFPYLLTISLGVGIFFLAAPAHALTGSQWAGEILGGLIGWIIGALGLILVLVMQALIAVAQYSNFINSPAVSNGWHIVRDICNMFFVLVLLIIAFATILKIENYNYKKWLPKLILMAILINFSKTICGLLIDFAQVIMLTFVNAFKSIAAGNLIENLGITQILTLADNNTDVGFWAIVGAYVLGLIYILIALVVIVTMLAMLVMRIVMIWIYVVLSPAAYLFSAFPGGQKYASQWWSEFTKNLIVGPVLAFFIWLSFVSLQTQNIKGDFPTDSLNTQQVAAQAGIQSTDTGNIGATNASTPEVFIRFIIAIGMLLGGLKISQEIGGAAGSMAGKGMGAIQTGAKVGMGGVAAVTGYRYASGVLKSYSSQRKAKREEKFKMGAERLAGGIGIVKQKAMTPVNQSATWVRNKTVGRAGVTAQAEAAKAKELRQQADIIKSDFRRDGVIDGKKFSYDKKSRKWKNTDNPTETMDQKGMDKYLDSKVNPLETEATASENKSKEFRKKQNTRDKFVKAGMAVVGGVAGIATGGVGLLGVAGAAAFGIGVPQLGKTVKHAGETDLGLASNYRARQISEAKDKMKADSSEDVLATMDDSSKSAFVRAAASLEALDRGLLSINDATNKKEEIKQTMGGSTKDGKWRDKKLGSYVENMFDNKMPGGSKTFETLAAAKNNPDLMSTDPAKKAAAEAKKAAAERTVKDRIEQGVYSLDMDSGSLEKSMTYLANTMRNGEFAKQFKGLKSQAKKDSIVSFLKKDESQAGKEKLGMIKDLNYAFDDDQAGKEKALGKYSMEDISEIFRKGTAEQQEAIKGAVAGYSGTNKVDMFENAKNELEGNAPAIKDMRVKLGIDVKVNQTPGNAPGQNKKTQSKGGSAGNTGGPTNTPPQTPPVTPNPQP